MDFALSPKQLSIAQEARDFAEREIAPHVDLLETDQLFRQKLYVKMAQKGYFTMGDDLFAYLMALQAIANIDAGISVAMAVTNMVASSIKRFGTKAQILEYLPRVHSGECVPLAFALTEKESGSDAKSLSMVATPSDNGYILNGHKQFITNGNNAGCVLVMAKAPEGVTAFLVDQGTKGFTSPKTEKKLGLLTANLAALNYEDCEISSDKVLGKVGEGFSIAMSSLDAGRIGIAAQSLGIAEAAYEAALNYSKGRKQFGHVIADNQIIAFKLADMKLLLDAGKLLMYKAAWLLQKGEKCTLEASEAKLFCSEAANKIAGDALQIHGGYGYVKDYLVEKYFRDARVTTLYEGTSEIQRLIISRSILNNVTTF